MVNPHKHSHPYKTNSLTRSYTLSDSLTPTPSPQAHPLGGVVEHLLPGRVELPVVLLQQPLLGQGDGLLGGPQHLRRPLEVLGGLLGL